MEVESEDSNHQLIGRTAGLKNLHYQSRHIVSPIVSHRSFHQVPGRIKTTIAVGARAQKIHHLMVLETFRQAIGTEQEDIAALQGNQAGLRVNELIFAPSAF